MSRGFGVIFYDVSRGKMLHEKSTRNTNTSPFSLEKRVFPYHESLTNSKMLHILHMENRSAFNYARMLLLVVLMPEGGSLTQQFPTSYYYSMSSVENSQNFEEIELETGNNPLLDHENEVPEQYRIGKYNAH